METYPGGETLEQKRQRIIAKLTRESLAFKIVNDRYKRSNGLDSYLAHSKETSLSYLNPLLEELFMLDGSVELEDIPVQIRA